MTEEERYVGERLSLKGQLCTVRYLGAVADKPGSWLGVEWDDANRGKHNGTYAGVNYFTCRSKSLTCASFIRPAQSWDPSRSFLEAVREKYMPDFHENDAEIVYFSGKQAEEIGFEKFHNRQAKLQGIHVLVLDRMRIRHRPNDEAEKQAISDVCAEITELDLSGNLFESLAEVLDICMLLPRLRVLTLDGNRLSVDGTEKYSTLQTVRSLSLSRTFLQAEEINKILRLFPSVESVAFAENEVSVALQLKLPAPVKMLDLSDNRLTSLSDLRDVSSRAGTPHTLVLKRNLISTVGFTPPFSLLCTELDLTYNAISDWSFVTNLTQMTVPNLKHLRVAGNPMYKSLTSAEGKPLSTEDGYMLTIARLPHLESLNYAKITEKERLNAETYYLSQIAIELSHASAGQESRILAQHPRYKALCEEYGEPAIHRERAPDEIDPNSLAAKLTHITFELAPHVLPHVVPRSWPEELPKSWKIYSVLGAVGKRLGVMPLDLRLVLETNERDPVGRDRAYAGPEWWDSSDEEEESKDGEWVRREVELVAGTNSLGTYVEGREATVRVEFERRR